MPNIAVLHVLLNLNTSAVKGRLRLRIRPESPQQLYLTLLKTRKWDTWGRLGFRQTEEEEKQADPNTSHVHAERWHIWSYFRSMFGGRNCPRSTWMYISNTCFVAFNKPHFPLRCLWFHRRLAWCFQSPSTDSTIIDLNLKREVCVSDVVAGLRLLCHSVHAKGISILLNRFHQGQPGSVMTHRQLLLPETPLS